MDSVTSSWAAPPSRPKEKSEWLLEDEALSIGTLGSEDAVVVPVALGVGVWFAGLVFSRGLEGDKQASQYTVLFCAAVSRRHRPARLQATGGQAEETADRDGKRRRECIRTIREAVGSSEQTRQLVGQQRSVL